MEVEARDKIANQLAPEDLSESQRLAREWDAAHPREAHSTILSGSRREGVPHAVMLKPFRAGAHASLLDAVSQCPVANLAYPSCDPKTSCRDRAILHRKRFKIRSVRPIDMMPQTRQVEALARLTRSERRSLRRDGQHRGRSGNHRGHCHVEPIDVRVAR